MKVINILTDSYDVFVDFLLKKMSINNINYLAINYDKYTELHLSDNIYRIYDKKHIDLNKNYIYFKIVDLVPYNIKSSRNSFDSKFVDAQSNSIDFKREKTGYKKYTKTMIKKDSKKYSSKYNSKRRK